MAVREACGIFDVSHMGEIETSGPGATELLQRLLSNDVARSPGARSTASSAARTAACSTTSSRPPRTWTTT